MIKQLKSNIVLVYAFAVLFIVTASVSIFYKDIPGRYYFFNWYSGFMETVEKNTVFDYFLTVLVIVLTGYFINRAFNKTSFYNKTTGFPIFIFVLILSTLSRFYFETYFIIDLLFALLFLKIIGLDQNRSAIHISFLSGILVGISFLFSFWMLPIGLVVFYSLLTFRPFQWREWLVGVLGMSLPALYLFSVRYLFLNNFQIKPKTFIAVSEQLYWYDYLSYTFLLVIVFMALLGLRQQFKFQSNIESKQINILAFFTILTFLISASIYWVYKVEYFIFIVPLTLIVSLPIVNVKQGKFLNVLMISLMVLNLLRIFVF